jgi:hypothetical protein
LLVLQLLLLGTLATVPMVTGNMKVIGMVKTSTLGGVIVILVMICKPKVLIVLDGKSTMKEATDGKTILLIMEWLLDLLLLLLQHSSVR